MPLTINILQATNLFIVFYSLINLNPSSNAVIGIYSRFTFPKNALNDRPKQLKRVYKTIP